MNVNNSPVVNEVVSTLERLYGKRLSKIFLYGSYARGTQTPESDIDFLVMLKDKNVSSTKEIDYFIKDVSKLSDKYNIEISVKAAPENFFENQNSLFSRFLKQEAVLLAEKA